MAEYVKVARAAEVSPGQRKSFWVLGQRVLVFNIDRTFYACDESCPHRQCSMEGGILNGKVIVCPCHQAQFDLETGDVLVQPVGFPPTIPVPIHEVKVEEGDLYVALSLEADYT